jgi:hypothetical protein
MVTSLLDRKYIEIHNRALEIQTGSYADVEIPGMAKQLIEDAEALLPSINEHDFRHGNLKNIIEWAKPLRDYPISA